MIPPHFPIVWNPAYSVGSPLLDQHHRHLAQLINQLAACAASEGLSERVADILESLISYAEYHFGEEESLMEAAGFPELATHRHEHVRFCETTAETCYKAMHGIIRVDELAGYLIDWWNGHVLVEDMKFRPYLESSEDLLQPAL